MDFHFGPTTTLTSILMDYLHLKDVAKLKQVSFHHNLAIRDKIPNWIDTIQNQYHVLPCNICFSIRSCFKIEHCPLCEKDVCVDHLEICNSCNNVYCYRCRGYCC